MRGTGARRSAEPHATRDGRLPARRPGRVPPPSPHAIGGIVVAVLHHLHGLFFLAGIAIVAVAGIRILNRR